MDSSKKTILIQTDYLGMRSGLGRNGKELAFYLHKTGKYNIVYFGTNGTVYENPDYARYPFPVHGCLPNNPQEIDNIHKHKAFDYANYGGYYIDRLIKEYKPFAAIFSNDSWAFPYYGKVWWDKFHCIPHITLDSLPFLPAQKEFIEHSKQFLVWTEFAEKEAKKLGYNNVKTLTGIINEGRFKKLPEFERRNLRAKHNIPEDAFICGFVFRNQGRKEVGPLMEGYAQFKKYHPEVKNPRLLFHTHWYEHDQSKAWDFHRFCDEFGIPRNEVLTTHICTNCGQTHVKEHTKRFTSCPTCHAVPTNDDNGPGLTTCSVSHGCSEVQMNEVFNLMDCYCHPFNAGGLEIPIVEALFTELPTAVSNYAAGETFVEAGVAYSIDSHFSYQTGSQFKRANPYPSSISKFLYQVYSSDKAKQIKKCRENKQWAIEHFSVASVGKQWDDLLSSLPPVTYNYEFEEKQKNPNATVEDIADDKDWIKLLYKEILACDVSDEDKGLKDWLASINNGVSRKEIENYFRNAAAKENNKGREMQLTDLLGPEKPEDRVMVCIPESLGDCIMVTSLLRDARELYHDKKLYIATKPQYMEIFAPLLGELIDYVIPWIPAFDNAMAMELIGDQGYFSIVLNLHKPTQRDINYLHGGQDRHKLQNLYINESQTI